MVRRLLRHLCTTPLQVRRAFPAAVLEEIAAAVRAGERQHGGEIRVAIESDLPLGSLLSKQTPRARAADVFAHLNVWNTAARNGVLIYLCWADRDIEIVADTGFNGLVTAEQWERVCHDMEVRLRRKEYALAITDAVRAVSVLIAPHFPARDRNELPDTPAVL